MTPSPNHQDHVADNELILEVRDLGVSFTSDFGDVRAVNGVSFDLRRGDVLGIVGESGSGKTVASRALARLLPKTARLDPESRILIHRNEATIDVASLSRDSKEFRKVRGGDIATIFQEPMASFVPTHRIGRPIMEAAMLHRSMTKAEARVVALELLERVGISDPETRIDQYPMEFSGGMRQRVMIAVALASHPSILVADEPTTALDVTIQAQILELLRELRDELGMAIIFITHDLGVISQIADNVAVMYLGEIVERGTVREVVTDPQHPYTRRLLAAIPKLESVGDRLAAIPGDIPGSHQRPQGCPFWTRCEEMIPGECNVERIAEVQLTDSHAVRCVLHREERES